MNGILSLCLCILPHLILAYPNGPPVNTVTSICGTMLPQHGASAQQTQNPYTISLSQTCYKTGDKIKVEVKGSNFKGYLIEARQGTADTASYGMFMTSDTDQQAYNCFSKMNVSAYTPINMEVNRHFNDSKGITQLEIPFNDTRGMKNVIGHNKNTQKSSTQFYWQAGASDNVDITFTGTIVAMKVQFWAGVQSSVLTYDPNCTETTQISTTTTVATTPSNAPALNVFTSLLVFVLAVFMALQ